jgi:hypothetical protein
LTCDAPYATPGPLPIGRDLKTQKVPDNFEAEVREALDNIGIILREAKLTYAEAPAPDAE